MLKRYIQNSRADLPTYGPPPYDGSPFAWARFFLKPHTGKLSLYFGLNLVRNCFFQAQPFFLGVLVGLVQSGQAQTDPQSILHWLLFYGTLSILVFAMLVFVIPTGRLIDLISKQISLYGFRHYLSLSESWHENRASGEKLQRLLSARDGF
jgi:ABC-type multidrug transport system fused ATPase/permease subunit